MRVACIGSRSLSAKFLDFCFTFGQFIARLEGEVHTGNAEGADQAFARGANTVDPRLVHLHLPWPNYNAGAVVPRNVVHLPQEQSNYTEIAAEYHPTWRYLKQGVKKLHTRNVSIICWPQLKDLVLAFPGGGVNKGGTGQGIRIATGYEVRVVDFSDFVVNDGIPIRNLHDTCELIRNISRQTSNS